MLKLKIMKFKELDRVVLLVDLPEPGDRYDLEKVESGSEGTIVYVYSNTDKYVEVEFFASSNPILKSVSIEKLKLKL